MKIILYILLLLIQFSCVSTKLTELNNAGEVIYSVDKVGIYIYNCETNTSKKIYVTDKIFLPISLELINDSLILAGHQGETHEVKKDRLVNSKYFYRADGDSSFITDNPPYTIVDKYTYLTETFFAINIENSKLYKYKTIDYETNEEGLLKINTRFYSLDSSMINQFDTSYIYGYSSNSSKGISFRNSGRFYSKSEIANNRQVFSERGNLILKDKGKETVLLKFDGHFDPKFGSGYYNPTISSDGKKVAFQYLAGFLNSGSAIFEMNIETKEKEKILGEGYFKPKYSWDGNYLIISKDNRKNESNNTWISDIYILNIKTGKKTKIAEGDNYSWR